MWPNSLITYTFERWINIQLPKSWEYTIDEQDAICNIYSLNNPKGALQISFYRMGETRDRTEVANDFVERFTSQFGLEVDQSTKMLIHRDDYTISIAAGICNGRYLKLWCLTEGERALLASYNSLKRTREVSTVDDIVFGIRFI